MFKYIICYTLYIIYYILYMIYYILYFIILYIYTHIHIHTVDTPSYTHWILALFKGHWARPWSPWQRTPKLIRVVVKIRVPFWV